MDNVLEGPMLDVQVIKVKKVLGGRKGISEFYKEGLTECGA